MAVGNVLNGLFQGYRLINIAADTLRNAYTLQSLAVAANSKTIDKNTENLSKNAVIQDTVAQPEIEDTSKAFIDQTTAATINTNAIAKNSQIKAGQEVATKVKKSSKKTPPLGQLSLLDDKQFYDELHYDLEANHQLFKNITDAKSGGNSLDSKKINNSANALEKVNNALKNGNKESHTFGQNVATLLTGKGTSGKGLLGLVTSHPFIVAAIAGIAASI